MQRNIGLDLERDVFGWLGDLTAFGRGTSLASLEGAVSISSENPDASGRFVAALGRLAREDPDGLRVGDLAVPELGSGITLGGPQVGPQPVHFFDAGERVVLAYGDAAARDAVSAQETLGDQPAFRAAFDALGEDFEPSAYVAAQPLIDLIEASTGTPPQYRLLVKPYLDVLEALVAGSRGNGEITESVFELRLR